MKKIIKILILLVIFSLIIVNSQVFAESNKGKFIEIGKTIYNHGQVYLTKLKNGKVLISDFDVLSEKIGEKIEEKDKYQKKFELYNPKTKQFEAMAQPIYWHSNSQPILLDDGSVFIAGNTCGRYATQFQKDMCENSQYSEIYNPETNEFKLAGKMKIPRVAFGVAKLLNGRVLITDGLSFKDDYSVNKYDNSIEFKPHNELYAEIFDPKSEIFSLTAKSSINASTWNTDELDITLNNGEVLVLWPNEAIAEIYNPQTGKFRKTIGGMVKKRNGWPPPTVQKLQDGRVLIIGGGTLQTAEIFDPKTENFIELRKLAASHGDNDFSGHLSILKNGQVLIIGGGTANHSIPYRLIQLKTMEIFDPKTDTFKYIGEKDNDNVGYSSILLDDGNVFFMSNCSKYKYKHTCGELYLNN